MKKIIFGTVRIRVAVVLTLLFLCLSSGWELAANAGCKDKVSGLFKGLASWYGDKFHGRRTASGQIYDENKFTCAHRTLPFGTSILVTNPGNGKECTVVVTDRGPHAGCRVIDLSKAAARRLGIVGVGKVVCSTGNFARGAVVTTGHIAKDALASTVKTTVKTTTATVAKVTESVKRETAAPRSFEYSAAARVPVQTVKIVADDAKAKGSSSESKAATFSQDKVIDRTIFILTGFKLRSVDDEAS